MKKQSESLYNGITHIEEQLVEEAQADLALSRRGFRIGWIAAAACLCLIVGAAWALFYETPAILPSEEAITLTPLVEDVPIYYVVGGEIHEATQLLACAPQPVFAAWRERNGIGEEVTLLDFHIEDNGVESSYEWNGIPLTAYQMGDYFIAEITVSQNLEAYYDAVDSEKLLQSLKQTMCGFSSIEFDEVHLTLA